MALYKISSSRVNNIQAEDYTGSTVEEGLIWYDPEQGVLRLYNPTLKYSSTTQVHLAAMPT